MSVSAITISQDNKLTGCNLLAIHNPLVFLIDVTYSGETPQKLYCDVINSESVTLATYQCIPYQDISNYRQFAFVADQIIRGEMDDFKDYNSDERVLEFVPNITKQFTLKFYIDETLSAETDFTACHAARQYGDSPAMQSISQNTNENTYIAGEGRPVYIYFYNDDETNVITVGSAELEYLRLLDYDSVALLDFDGLYLIAQ